MKREDVRRENARILAKEAGGAAEFARKTGMEGSQVSQLIGRTPKKNIGNLIAQRIENAFGLPSGWLDIPPASERLPAFSGDVPGAMRVVVQEDNSPEQYLIPKVALRLQAGISGYRTEADARDNGVMGLPRSWVEKKGYDPAHLLAIEVRGESMEPTFYEGDTVVINLADTQKMDNAVYAVNYDGEAVVKRLSRDQRQWWLMSDNPDQRKFYRRACQGAECIIIGRIVRREGDHF